MIVNKERIKEFLTLFLQHGIIIFLSLALLVQCEENRILKEDSNSREIYIDKLKERDSLYKVYMGANEDGSFVYLTRDSNIISYKNLIDERDSLFSKNNKLLKEKNTLKDSLCVKNALIMMLKEEYDFNYKIKRGNDGLSVSLSVKKIAN